MDELAKDTPVRAGNWGGWKTQGEKVDPAVVRQWGEMCGHCAVQMVAQDAEVRVTLAEVTELIGRSGPTTHDELVDTLNGIYEKHFKHQPWMAGEISEEARAKRFALYHPSTWIAMMIKEGEAHWLAVNGRGDQGVIFVRDSADGTSYVMDWEEFQRYWNRTMVVRR